MHPILLSLGRINIYSYGFMVSLGFFFGILLAWHLAKATKVNPENVFDISLFVLIFSIIGARIFYVIFYYFEIKSFWEIFMIWNGGLVFYGGLLFAILAIFLASKIYNVAFLEVLDIAAPATALGYAFGRMGCFLNGCCYGVECSVPWGVKFPALEGLRHPTQIYASITALLILAVLLFVFYRKKFDGQVFSLGILFYSVYRLLIEFLRINPKMIFNLSSAQVLSIFGIILSITIYAILNKKTGQR